MGKKKYFSAAASFVLGTVMYNFTAKMLLARTPNNGRMEL
jgi:hypothetical protein